SRPAEAAVDLDEIDLEAAQIVERVGAGAEIVEAHLEAAPAQRLDAGVDVLDAGDLRRFGDLEEDAPRQVAVDAEQREERVGEGVALERLAREVDGNRDLAVGILDHRLDDEVADREVEIADEPHRLGKGDGGARRPALGEAGERLEMVD